ncbi:MAG: 50S ribosomal protein L25 [Sorangium cellulosum]|nr:MAG: 50S ribosomal protein L25 [Sorangium cellulosum]
MEFLKIDASLRTARGKGPNARLRRSGKIPAVAYGPGHPSTALTVDPAHLTTALTGPWGRNAVLEVAVEGAKPFNALVADYTYHPVTRALLHADFIHIDLNKPVDVEVPLVPTGKAIGVVEGGTLRVIFRSFPISCLPKDIPQAIEIDVTEMKENDVRHVSDLSLPEGVTVRLPPEQTIIAVDAAVVEEEEEIEEGVEGEGAEGAEAAAAPAEESDAEKK